MVISPHALRVLHYHECRSLSVWACPHSGHDWRMEIGLAERGEEEMAARRGLQRLPMLLLQCGQPLMSTAELLGIALR
jgi:hypothetical protein